MKKILLIASYGALLVMSSSAFALTVVESTSTSQENDLNIISESVEVPAPSSLVLLGLGAIGLLLVRRRK